MSVLLQRPRKLGFCSLSIKRLNSFFMIGFELTVNGIATTGALDAGVTSINVNRVKNSEKDEIDIFFGGFDMVNQKNIRWLFKSLSIEDRIVIQIKDIQESSFPEKIESINQNALLIDGKMRAYLELKKELEQEGLI